MYLEPRHYRDVIDERHIELLCGWPMCSNKLGDVPTARYHVSVRRRVVVDLTQRKVYRNVHTTDNRAKPTNVCVLCISAAYTIKLTKHATENNGHSSSHF